MTIIEKFLYYGGRDCMTFGIHRTKINDRNREVIRARLHERDVNWRVDGILPIVTLD